MSLGKSIKFLKGTIATCVFSPIPVILRQERQEVPWIVRIRSGQKPLMSLLTN